MNRDVARGYFSFAFSLMPTAIRYLVIAIAWVAFIIALAVLVGAAARAIWQLLLIGWSL